MCLSFSLINNVSVFRTILEKIGLQEKVTPLQAKKKWDNLKSNTAESASDLQSSFSFSSRYS